MKDATSLFYYLHNSSTLLLLLLALIQFILFPIVGIKIPKDFQDTTAIYGFMSLLIFPPFLGMKLRGIEVDKILDTSKLLATMFFVITPIIIIVFLLFLYPIDPRRTIIDNIFFVHQMLSFGLSTGVSISTNGKIVGRSSHGQIWLYFILLLILVLISIPGSNELFSDHVNLILFLKLVIFGVLSYFALRNKSKPFQ